MSVDGRLLPPRLFSTPVRRAELQIFRKITSRAGEAGGIDGGGLPGGAGSAWPFILPVAAAGPRGSTAGRRPVPQGRLALLRRGGPRRILRLPPSPPALKLAPGI